MSNTEKAPLMFKSPTGSEITLSLPPMHSVTVGEEWVEVHPMFHRIAMANGCIRSDMSPEAIRVMTEDDNKQPEAPESQDEVIIAAMKAMKEEGNEEDFTGSGYPDLRRLRSRVGFGVDRIDMVRLWDQMEGRAADSYGDDD